MGFLGELFEEGRITPAPKHDAQIWCSRVEQTNALKLSSGLKNVYDPRYPRLTHPLVKLSKAQLCAWEPRGQAVMRPAGTSFYKCLEKQGA